MLEMNWHISPPVLLTGIITPHDPIIAGISTPVVSESTDFLIAAEGRLEEV